MKSLIVRFDTNLTSSVQNIPHMNGFMRRMTLLGDPFLVITLGFSGMFYGWMKDKSTLTSVFAVALLAYALGCLLKEFIHRTRPDTVYVTSMKFKSYSFPSAHALGAMIFYGLLAYFTYLNLPIPWSFIFPSLFLGLIFLIGVSRVYLGAHYPTDVIGGWLLGAIALLGMLNYVLS